MRIVCCFALLLAGCHPRGGAGDHLPPLPLIQDPPRAAPHEREVIAITPVAAREETSPAIEPTRENLPKPESARISEVNGALEDVYFAYDRSELSADALAALERDASLLCAILAEFPGLRVVIEGHCDERGSAEYNLALGDRRAGRAAEVLRANGVQPGAAQVVSYGKESPQCTEPRESCYERNRRAHLSVKR